VAQASIEVQAVKDEKHILGQEQIQKDTEKQIEEMKKQ
jgi:hypothetical protein